MNDHLQNPNCHFDQSNALRCEVEKSFNKTDSSTRLDESGLARNDKHTHTKPGFSLTEVLLALGTLAVGMLFIAGVFPASIHLTTVASERTIAAAVADEAFAKIKLYNIEPSGLPFNAQVPLENVPLKNGGFLRDANEFGYPSTPVIDPYSKRYWWSAICRKVSLDPQSRDVQVTVFVSRKVGAVSQYWARDPVVPPALINNVARPVPVYITITTPPSGRADELAIKDLVPADGIDERAFINDGYTIVDNTTGNIYRVLERYSTNQNVIRLDKDWSGLLPGSVWVIPSPSTGGRYPCIAVYQKIIRF